MKIQIKVPLLCASIFHAPYIMAEDAVISHPVVTEKNTPGSNISGTLPSVAKMAQNTVTIARDTWGTPHIFAQNDYALYFGYGYSLAEDRLYQLEMLKRSTQGTVAEVLGEEYLAFDKSRRQLFWPSDIKKQIEKASPMMRQILSGMAKGINHHIQRVKENPDSLLPQEFHVNSFMPSQWTDYDVAMLFIGTMLLRYGDFNTELENQRLLNDLTQKHGADVAMDIFNDALPRFSKQAPLTIPATDWQKKWASRSQNTSEKSQTAAQNIQTKDIQSPKLPLPPVNQNKPRGHAFSNALVLSRRYLKSDAAVLINGPQFGWYTPAYTYAAGFHTPDWDAVGNAPVGFPLPMFGYNAHITWGSTWAAMDNVDIFREELHPTDTLQYKHQGQWKTFRTRKEIISIKNAPPQSFTVKASIHGPIIAADKDARYAYAKQRGWTGRELSTLEGWVLATRAKNHRQWHQAVSQSALNVNWYFADKNGNIGYASMGAYPIRHPDHDNRLPVSGTGTYDWQGTEGPAYPPQVLNPSSGYVANWNNKPGKGVLNPDQWWASWSGADRVKILDDAVKENGKMTADEAWHLMMQASFKDPNAAYFKPQMIAVLRSLKGKTPQQQKILTQLESWNDYFQDTKNGHYTHPAIQIFRTWLGNMLALTLADDMPGAIGQAFATTTGYGTPDKPTSAGLNISTGLKLLYEVTQGNSQYDFTNGEPIAGLWQRSLRKTIRQLTQSHGPNPEKWLLPVPATRFRYKNFLGIPQTLANRQRDDMPDMNRGTENNMTIFPKPSKNHHVTGREILPPGQSGFIAPNGQAAAHSHDQYDLYQQLKFKPTWLRKMDIQKNITTIRTLKIPKRKE